MAIARKSLFLALAAASLALAAGCSDIPIARAPDGVPRGRWMSALPGAMGEELCSSESALRQCYSVTEDECQQRVSRLTTSCERVYQSRIPPRLRESDLTNWGSTIGGCTEGAMLRYLSMRYTQNDTEACQQALASM